MPDRKYLPGRMWYTHTRARASITNRNPLHRLLREHCRLEARRRYYEFCTRLVHAQCWASYTVSFVLDLRSNHPVLYPITAYSVALVALILGLHVGDLLLFYLLALACLLIPGIRHKDLFGVSFLRAGRYFGVCSVMSVF